MRRAPVQCRLDSASIHGIFGLQIVGSASEGEIKRDRSLLGKPYFRSDDRLTAVAEILPMQRWRGLNHRGQEHSKDDVGHKQTCREARTASGTASSLTGLAGLCRSERQARYPIGR